MKRTKHTGKIIKTLRRRTSLSQKAVAIALGKSQTYISRVERGLKIPETEEIKAILNILNQPESAYDSLMKTQSYLEELAMLDETTISRTEKKIPLRQLKRSEVLALGNQFFEGKAIEKAWLFGSFARAEQTATSDIDVLIQFKKDYKATLIDLIRIKNQLEDLTGYSVDLVENGSEYEHLRSNIHEDKIAIYG